MKIHLLSDLHLEFEDFTPPPTGADVVVLAGDIHIGSKGVEWALKHFPDRPVLYVLGNHEYYRHTYPKLLRELAQLALGTSLQVLENRAVTIGGVTFHGATLWTDFALFGDPRIAGYECQQRMNDYRRIRREPGYSKVRSIDIAVIHQQSLHWLRRSLLQSTTRHNVVISHHAPSPQSLSPRFQGDILSAAYASQLEPLMRELSPDLWLHGHLHSSSDYQVGRCRVCCNPRGYSGENNPEFAPGLLLELAS